MSRLPSNREVERELKNLEFDIRTTVCVHRVRPWCDDCCEAGEAKLARWAQGYPESDEEGEPPHGFEEATDEEGFEEAEDGFEEAADEDEDEGPPRLLASGLADPPRQLRPATSYRTQANVGHRRG